MFIIPMNGITPLETITQKPIEKTNESSSASFADIFKQAINNVEDTQKVCEEDNIKIALGEVDDLHTVQVNMQKAATALDVLVSMKNTAVEAYSEIMRMNI